MKTKWLFFIFSVSRFVAELAETYKIIYFKTLGGVLVDWNDVMNLWSRSCLAFFITILTQWISNSVVFAESPPSVVISPRGCVIALRTSIRRIVMTLRAKLLHHLQSFVDLMQIISSDRQKNREAHSRCTPLPLFGKSFSTFARRRTRHWWCSHHLGLRAGECDCLRRSLVCL